MAYGKDYPPEKLKFTPNMRRGIEAMMAYPFATQEEIANLVGCSVATVRSWKYHPLFQEVLEKRLKEEWKDARKVAQATIIDLAKDGDFQASKYILDSNGYNATQKVEIENNQIKVTIDSDD